MATLADRCLAYQRRCKHMGAACLRWRDGDGRRSTAWGSRLDVDTRVCYFSPFSSSRSPVPGRPCPGAGRDQDNSAEVISLGEEKQNCWSGRFTPPLALCCLLAECLNSPVWLLNPYPIAMSCLPSSIKIYSFILSIFKAPMRGSSLALVFHYPLPCRTEWYRSEAQVT